MKASDLNELVAYLNKITAEEDAFEGNSDGFECGYKACIVDVKNYFKNDPTKCRQCGRNHWLTDDDAGSEQEIERLCDKCFKELTTEGNKNE